MYRKSHTLVPGEPGKGRLSIWFGHSALMFAAIVFITAALFPSRGYASNAADLAAAINNWGHGGTAASFNASASGNVVTVTGSVTGVVHGITLDIDSGVTVAWKVVLEGRSYASGSSDSFVILWLKGGGVFKVASGGDISIRGGNCAAIAANPGGTVIEVESGGSVSAPDAKSTAIVADGFSSAVTVNVRGKVSAGGTDSVAISASGYGGPTAVNVYPGGQIIGTGGSIAVYLVYGAKLNDYTGGTGITGSVREEKEESAGCDTGFGGLIGAAFAGIFALNKRRSM
jgi:hypothetical protein